MKYKKLLIFIIIILLIVVFICVFKDKILKIFYPRTYNEFVSVYAEKYDVDKNLIFAVIKAESNFNDNAVSHRNSV